MPATDVAPPMFIGGWWVDVVLVDVAVDMTYPMFAVRRAAGRTALPTLSPPGDRRARDDAHNICVRCLYKRASGR
jgi:hypothetical protein